MPQEYVTVCSPVFLIQFEMNCNLCNLENQVAVIATFKLLGVDDDEVPEGDGVLLSELNAVPEWLLLKILDIHPNYELRYSITAGLEYWMSTCSCGGHYGDFYVHRKALDMAWRSPNKLKVTILHQDGELQLNSGFTCSQALGDFLKEVSESPVSKNPFYAEGYEHCLKSKGVSYSNPYLTYTEQFNMYERGWFQASKKHFGNFPDISSEVDGRTYKIDLNKL